MNLIEIQNLSKIYFAGKDNELRALDSISFVIEKRQFLAIMGPSGSGKSTLMHIIGLLDRPSSGIYKLKGEDVTKKSGQDLARLRNRTFGFVFQSFNLLPRTSALNNVLLPTVYGHIEHRREKARKILALVGLSGREKNKPNQLSGGEEQRVAIARALICDPEIILADEPTGNLDSKSGRGIMELLTNLNKSGKTIILVTHDLSLAKYAQGVINLKDGKIV